MEVEELLQQVQEASSGKKELVEKYLLLMTTHPQTFLFSNPGQTRKDLIQLYRDSLAGPLKALNIKIVKRFV